MTRLRAAGADLGRVIALTRPLGRRLSLSVALGSAAIVAALALLAVSGVLISRAALRPEVLALVALITTTRVLSLVRSGARYGERLVSHNLALRALARLRIAVYERVAPLVPGGLGLRPADALSRVVADIDVLENLYLRAIAPPLTALVALVACVTFLAIVLPLAAPLLVVGMIGCGVLVPAAGLGLSMRSGLREADARGRLAETLIETVRGAPELIAAGREADAVGRVRSADRALLSLQGRDAAAQGLALTAGGLVQGLTLAGVLAVGVTAAAAGRLSGVLLAAVVLVTWAAFEATAPLAEAVRRLAACAGAARRLGEVMDAVPAVRDPVTPVSPPAGAVLHADKLTVLAPDDGRALLRGVSLWLAPGARVAIVGPSGAGKTTLARALVRFVDPARGDVRLGGVPVAAVAQHELRRRVRLVSQEAHLFTTTLRGNVAIGRPDADDSEIGTALVRAGLGDWVAALPRGLDTPLGEEGAAVSGGQRRRIALARGLIADADHLILDEPTAHLDADGAAQLLGRLGRDRSDRRGILVIDHTCTGLEDFDEIIVLAAGRIVQRGRHSRLVAAGGAYTALFTA